MQRVFLVHYQSILYISSKFYAKCHLAIFHQKKIFMMNYLTFLLCFPSVLLKVKNWKLSDLQKWFLTYFIRVTHFCMTLTDISSYFFSFFFFFFRATPAAYGRSQARGRIGAVAASYATATARPDPSLICDLCRSSWQC